MNKPHLEIVSAGVATCPQLSPQDRTGQDRTTEDFFLATPSLPTVNVRLGADLDSVPTSDLLSRLRWIDAQLALEVARRSRLADLEHQRAAVDAAIAGMGDE